MNHPRLKKAAQNRDKLNEEMKLISSSINILFIYAGLLPLSGPQWTLLKRHHPVCCSPPSVAVHPFITSKELSSDQEETKYRQKNQGNAFWRETIGATNVKYLRRHLYIRYSSMVIGTSDRERTLNVIVFVALIAVSLCNEITM